MVRTISAWTGVIEQVVTFRPRLIDVSHIFQGFFNGRVAIDSKDIILITGDATQYIKVGRLCPDGIGSFGTSGTIDATEGIKRTGLLTVRNDD